MQRLPRQSVIVPNGKLRGSEAVFQSYLSKISFQSSDCYYFYVRKTMNVIDPHVVLLFGMTDWKNSFTNINQTIDNKHGKGNITKTFKNLKNKEPD